MKKAVISTGSKQFLVAEGDIIDIELISASEKPKFDALLTIDGDTVSIGAPVIEGVVVAAEILDPEVKADKVVSIRYKAKKRVHKLKGHRQRHTRIKITSIGAPAKK